MDIIKTNTHERCVIECAVDSLFVKMEGVSKTLNLVLNLYFSDIEDKTLSESAKDAVGSILFSVVDILDNIALEYDLTVGRNNPHVAAHLESMRRVEAALKVEKLSFEAAHLMRDDDGIRARLDECRSMPDEQAAAGLEALLGEISE